MIYKLMLHTTSTFCECGNKMPNRWYPFRFLPTKNINSVYIPFICANEFSLKRRQQNLHDFLELCSILSQESYRLDIITWKFIKQTIRGIFGLFINSVENNRMNSQYLLVNETKWPFQHTQTRSNFFAINLLLFF